MVFLNYLISETSIKVGTDILKLPLSNIPITCKIKQKVIQK